MFEVEALFIVAVPLMYVCVLILLRFLLAAMGDISGRRVDRSKQAPCTKDIP